MTGLVVIFHSFRGTLWRLAEGLAAGAQEAGAEVTLARVNETTPAEALSAAGIDKAQEAFAHLPVATPQMLIDHDGIALGCGTRFGSTSAAMQSFLDQTGPLWREGRLVGKTGTAFSASGAGVGQEATIRVLWTFFAHQGMVIVPPGYRSEPMRDPAKLLGASPYGAGSIAFAPAPRPSEEEMALARAQGSVWAGVTARLLRGGRQDGG